MQRRLKARLLLFRSKCKRMMPTQLLPALSRRAKKKSSTEESSCGGGDGVICHSSGLPKQQQVEELICGGAFSDSAAYARLSKNDGTYDSWRKEFFQKAHILVLGRSGVGKTTLIRLMVGKNGPHTVSEGVAGVQNINEEFLFSSEEQGVRLVIHDSNGMDVKGKEHVNEIKVFLDKRQKGDDFMEHIHIVWYVISAIDPRCVDDGDVMKMITEYKLPVLLIMTHNDHDKVKVTDTVLDMLLQRAYTEDEERKAVKRMMVRVGNDGVSMSANNELVIDESKFDTEGLMLVAKRTQQLMDKIAAQAVDKEGKQNRHRVGQDRAIHSGRSCAHKRREEQIEGQVCEDLWTLGTE